MRQFIFSSTCAVYGNPAQVPVTEDTLPVPISPYGWSKPMTEIMLRDAGTAHDLHYVILRYFNVAGADPNCRAGAPASCGIYIEEQATLLADGAIPTNGSALGRRANPSLNEILIALDPEAVTAQGALVISRLHAAFEEAMRRRPGRIVTLRQKTRMLSDSRRRV